MAKASLVAYAENVQFSSTTVSVTIPTNVQVGNQLLLVITRGPTGSNAVDRIGVMTAGTGWTNLNSVVTGSAASGLAQILYTKTADAADPGSTVTVGNVSPTGVVQSAIITAWTGPVVLYASVYSTGGSGTAISISCPTPVSTMTTGNTQLLIGSGRSNSANGSVAFFTPAAGNYTTVPASGYYSGLSQSIQTFVAYGTVPVAASKTSVQTVNGTSTLNSRTGYCIELGPGATYTKNLTARVSMKAVGAKNPIGYGKPLKVAAKVAARAEPPPTKGGFLVANVLAMRATGQRIRTGKATPLKLAVAWIVRGQRTQATTGQATLPAAIKLAGTGAVLRTATGSLRLGSASMTARGRNSDSIQNSAGRATLRLIAGASAEGFSTGNDPAAEVNAIGSYYQAELLYSTAGMVEKGITLAAGQGRLAAGVCIAQSVVDRKHYQFFDGADAALPFPIGILRTAIVVPDDEDADANILVCGIVNLDALSRHDIDALKKYRGATTSVGRNLLKF